MTKPTKKPPGIESDGAILPIGPFEPVESFEITRGQRGGLGWTIKAASVARAKAMDEEARKAFGDPGAA